MARQLIDATSGPSKPADYRDTYTDRVDELIEAKKNKEEFQPAEEAPAATKRRRPDRGVAVECGGGPGRDRARRHPPRRGRTRLPTPIQAGSRWDVKRMHARMNGCGKLRCCTGRPSRDAARVRRRGAPRRGRACQNAAQMLPREGEAVSPRAGLRSAHAGPAPAAMSIATADRTSPHPLTTTPAAPSHVPRHSLKGMTAVLLGRRERWRRWDAREAACPCSRRLAEATGLVVSSNAAVKSASRGIDFDVTYVAY